MENFYFPFLPDRSSTIMFGSMYFHSNSCGIYLQSSMWSLSLNPKVFRQNCFKICKFKIFSSFGISTFDSIYWEYDLEFTSRLQTRRTTVRSSFKFSGSSRSYTTICWLFFTPSYFKVLFSCGSLKIFPKNWLLSFSLTLMHSTAISFY